MTSMFHPLQPTFRQYTYNDYRTIINAKRKSAVEVLEETKPLYVKSSAVLKSHSPDDKHRDEAGCSPRSCSRRRQDKNGDLAFKLRRLLSSKENIRDEVWDKSEVQYKSLPDLSTSSHDSLGSTLHHISCAEGDQSSKTTSSSTTETGCSSSEKSYGKPPSLNRSCTSIGGSAGKVEARLSWRREEVERLSELCRSKSDPGEATAVQDNDLPLKLEEFFQFLGLSSHSYRNLTRVSSDASSPIYFPSGSSVDSSPKARGSECAPASTGGEDVGLSIVERNARVIKWLVACAKS